MTTHTHFDRLPPTADPAAIRRFLNENAFPLVEDSLVTFVYFGAAERVELRHWIYGLPGSIPLTRLGHTDLWFCAMEFPLGSRIEYKYGVTRHGHEEWLFDPLNDRVAFDPFGGNSVVYGAGYINPEWSARHEGVAEGRIERITIESEAFGDQRTIGVYLPASFRDYRRYRLLVVHDGDDYVKYSQLAAVLDNLISRQEIAPLVVALSNPHDRLIEYANDERHARHIVHELIPTLESRFPLITESSGRCIMGASFGGVASLSTAWRFPGVFDSMLVQSGSFAFADIGDHSRSPVFDPVVDFMNAFRKQPGEPVKQAYVSCGVYESLIYENRSLVPFLRQHHIDTKFEEAYDGHNWENWRDRLRTGLSWLFPGSLWETYY